MTIAICSICKDNLIDSDNIYHTECGHVFHYHCLGQWLERSKSCPQCREKVTRSKIHRLHLTLSSNQPIEDNSGSLKERIQSLEFKILLKEKDVQYYSSKNITLDKQNDGLKREVRKVESELRKQSSNIYELEMQLESCNTLKKELTQLKRKMEELKPLEILFNAPVGDVMRMVGDTKDSETLIKYISVLKKEFVESINKRKKLCMTIKKCQEDLAKADSKYASLLGEQSKRMELEEQLAFSESRNMALQKRVEELEKVLGINETNNVPETREVNTENNDHDKNDDDVIIKPPEVVIKNKNKNRDTSRSSITSSKRKETELSEYTIPKKRREDTNVRKQSTIDKRNIIDFLKYESSFVFPENKILYFLKEILHFLFGRVKKQSVYSATSNSGVVPINIVDILRLPLIWMKPYLFQNIFMNIQIIYVPLRSIVSKIFKSYLSLISCRKMLVQSIRRYKELVLESTLASATMLSNQRYILCHEGDLKNVQVTLTFYQNQHLLIDCHRRGYRLRNFVYKWSTFVDVIPSLIVKMSSRKEYIITPWEIEAYVQSLQTSELEDIGTKGWYEFHKRLMLLNQQSVLEISALKEESVKELFVSYKKIPILIYEAIQIHLWKHNGFPLLLRINSEPQNTFMLFTVFYHENLAVSLLENVLFHCESAETIDDSALDLVDYALVCIYGIVDPHSNEIYENVKTTNSCIEEILERKKELEFDIGIRCISILRYLAEFADNLPLSVLSRLLSTHDVPYLLAQLIESRPWIKENADGEKMIYDGSWKKIKAGEEEKISKIEGQVWIGLRELLLNPKSAPYYEITDYRISHLMKLQKYLHETVLDQISPLLELKRWLSCISVSSSQSKAPRPPTVELVPQIRTSINEKYHKKWKKLTKRQAKLLFTSNKEDVQNAAQILSDAYDLDKLDCIDIKECCVCREVARKRCSKCKMVWYCGRECQVKDWEKHKVICDKVTKTEECKQQD
ncbi:zinc finger MYND-type containing 10 [Halictus rubicundus]|uniref:zinc finger MYND-type containing 10 n=1 Tax=Halictus rubicundus TaxID=77578 RepID=UPI0040368B34